MGDDKNNPRLEPGIGQRLEKAREGMGLSFWEVEQETRIRSRYLRDLEREDFDVLPAVYVLGSLKTYADFLGLDGAALSRQLKASLVEPDEPDVPAQLGALGAADEDDEYEAAPVPAVGFNQLFLGMGVILISILAVMTIVVAVAQGDESPVAQITQPSTPEPPSEIALAGNVRDGDGMKKGGDDGPAKDENKEPQPENEPEASKGGEDQDGQQASSPFEGVEFVPMSPSSTRASASASAVPSSASPAPTSPSPSSPTSSSPTSSSPAPSSPEPSSPAPATVKPDDSPASTPPAAPEASPGSAEDGPDTASPAPAAPSGGASPRPGDGEGEPTSATNSDRLPAEAERKVDEAFEDAGLIR